MRNGGEKRGNTRDRRIRKLWMLAAYGDGVACQCVHCSCQLSYTTVEADRIDAGGSYRRENVQPSCRPCNSRRSNNPNWVGPAPSRVVPKMDAFINPAFLVRGSL